MISPALTLSASQPRVAYACGDFDAIYVLDPVTHAVGLRLMPHSHLANEATPRAHHSGPETVHTPLAWQPQPASRGEHSLVQLKLAEDPQGNAFTGGRSMRQNPTVDGLRLTSQTAQHAPDGSLRVRTELSGARNFSCIHHLLHQPGDESVTVWTEFSNQGDNALTLEMLSSFCLGHLTPFHVADASERLWVHRFRSCWADEGRHERVRIEDLHLERSWGGFGVTSERYGQVGSLPVRGWFPFVAVEDAGAGVFWAAQLHAPGSWQMEIFRRGDDRLSISGGLADREFGHWKKTIQPGETFTTLPAWLTVSTADFDTCCQRLTSMQAKPLKSVPVIERDLPVIFNEWCSSWGKPTPEFILRTANVLRELPVDIFVIDDGWAEKPPGGFQINGDWNIAMDRFPQGLAPVVRSLKKLGLRPGIWFEFEVCTEGSAAWLLTDHQLRRDGRVLQVGPRRFWDFTDPWTHDYLAEKVIARLREDGFEYLKVDYNDTIGIGCDHPDGLGEGLRAHLDGVQRFFSRLRSELPDLVIEICASGGHRLEPSFLALGAMASFSDAHEPVDLPIISADLHRLILPRQNQTWAVLHPSDSMRRLHYKLAACFLGRACLSGEVADLNEEQIRHVRSVLELYKRISPIIRDGRSRLLREIGPSRRHPRGWQAVVRTAGDEALVVFHAFEASAGTTAQLPWPEGSGWSIAASSGVDVSAEPTPAGLSLTVSADFSALILHLKRG
ncbi:MAG: alpha-galactosidase [Opitutus sp.]|nr:alpha-galactosidase [Opitutus sp.]MCS6246582.1 alpha-galactosidase [Opitutus sp.]MCS6272734.1 alpha-galactosidase [Opitutus sp.]MCS6276365.1 alpha-galactosidase [Opitutus sp.]MCS6301987.1 alpha-galactosidase [Opitutus sp.]